MTTQSITATPDSTSVSAISTEVKTKRYHPALVALHWLIALMIFGTVLLIQNNEGGERFRPGQGNFPPPQGQGFQQGNPPQGFQPGNFPTQEGTQSPTSTTGIHMIIGFTILVLLIARLIVRFTTKYPEWASAGINSSTGSAI